MHYIFRSFVALKIMTENKKVSKCAVCVTNCFIVEPGMNVTCVCVVALVPSHTFEILREHPSENHAVLKYESTMTLSDFVQILCRFT